MLIFFVVDDFDVTVVEVIFHEQQSFYSLDLLSLKLTARLQLKKRCCCFDLEVLLENAKQEKLPNSFH